jgi:hypothetical protein
MDKTKEAQRVSLMEERERLLEQKNRLMDKPLNLFEAASRRGKAAQVRPGNVDDKTRAIDKQYVATGKGDKTAAAAWDARMNYLDSRIQDINESLRRASPKNYELGQQVEKRLTGKRSDEFRKGGATKSYAKGGSVRGGGCETRTKKTRYV